MLPRYYGLVIVPRVRRLDQVVFGFAFVNNSQSPSNARIVAATGAKLAAGIMPQMPGGWGSVKDELPDIGVPQGCDKFTDAGRYQFAGYDLPSPIGWRGRRQMLANEFNEGVCNLSDYHARVVFLTLPDHYST